MLRFSGSYRSLGDPQTHASVGYHIADRVSWSYVPTTFLSPHLHHHVSLLSSPKTSVSPPIPTTPPLLPTTPHPESAALGGLGSFLGSWLLR